MLKTYTEFVKEINNLNQGIRLYKTLLDNTGLVCEARYCKKRIRESEAAIKNLLETYPIFTTLYNLNKARKAS